MFWANRKEGQRGRLSQNRETDRCHFSARRGDDSGQKSLKKGIY
jgi:hypothetical protein